MILNPVTTLTAPCKVCGESARILGMTDFNKNCEERRGVNLGFCGIPIYYHRCPACGFIFTTAFDHFTSEDFAKHIYNDEYAKVDPDYAEVRPELNAQWVAHLLGPERSIRILDYGGGDGRLVRKLREAGFTDVTCYDPFVPEFSIRPEGKFDLILCFEVVEHSTNPLQTFADIISMLNEPGMIHFSTCLQPKEITQAGVGWSYISPRNGHVSIFSQLSMELLAKSFGFFTGSFNENSHVMMKEIPPFARRFSPKAPG